VIKCYLHIFQAFISAYGKDNLVKSGFVNSNAQAKLYRSSEAPGFVSEAEGTTVKFPEWIKVLKFLLSDDLGSTSCSSSNFGIITF